MRLLALIALAAAWTASSASAQADYAIAGRVVDAATGDAVEAASVAVWRVSARDGVEPYLETGATTVADGAFRVDGLTRGRYYVVVSFVGYEPARVDGLRLSPTAPVSDVGRVALAEAAESLDGVEVTAQGERVRIEVDRTVYQVADDPILSGGSTSDALETIPSVEVDVDGNVSLRGVSNVVVLIDGRPAPVGRDFIGVYLQSLPAEAVESIEVLPNPSAAYQPDGSGGILNIVLREDKQLGVGGAVTVGGDSQGGGTGSALISVGRGPLRVSATVALRRSVRATDGERFRVNRFLGNAATEIAQSTLDDRERSSALASLTADLTVTPQTTLTASLDGSLRASSAMDETATRASVAGTALDAFTRRTASDGDGVNGSVRLGLRHDFEGVSQEGEPNVGRRRGGRGGRGGRRGGGGSRVSLGTHALSLDVRLRGSTGSDGDVLTETPLDGVLGLPVEQRIDAVDAGRSVIVQADYARPVGDARLELGYRGDLDARSDDRVADALDAVTGLFAPDDAQTLAYDLDERVHALYVQGARQIGTVAVQVGVRAEAASRSFAVGGETFDQDYRSLFPSASLAVDVADATVLRASYSRRIDRPRGRQLNPLPSTDDALNVRVGNPALRPEYTDAVEVDVVRQTAWGSVTATPYLRRTTDVVRRFQSVDSLGVTTSTFRNLDTATAAGLEAVVAYQAGGAVRGFLSLEGYRLDTDGSSVEAGLGADAFGWGGRANVNVAVGDWSLGALDLQTTASYRAPVATEQGRRGARMFFDLALRQRVLGGRGSLAVRARDPLALGRIDFVQDDERLFQTFTRSFGRQQVGVTFTYAFGQTEDRPERQRPGADGGQEEGGGLDF